MWRGLGRERGRRERIGRDSGALQGSFEMCAERARSGGPTQVISCRGRTTNGPDNKTPGRDRAPTPRIGRLSTQVLATANEQPCTF